MMTFITLIILPIAPLPFSACTRAWVHAYGHGTMYMCSRGLAKVVEFPVQGWVEVSLKVEVAVKGGVSPGRPTLPQRHRMVEPYLMPKPRPKPCPNSPGLPTEA